MTGPAPSPGLFEKISAITHNSQALQSPHQPGPGPPGILQTLILGPEAQVLKVVLALLQFSHVRQELGILQAVVPNLPSSLTLGASGTYWRSSSSCRPLIWQRPRCL